MLRVQHFDCSERLFESAREIHWSGASTSSTALGKLLAVGPIRAVAFPSGNDVTGGRTGRGGGRVLPHSKGRVSFWKSSHKLCQFECLSVRGRRAGRRRLRLSHENAKMTLRSNRSEGIEASVLIVAIEASKVPFFPETCAFALVVHMRRSVYDCFGLCNLLSHQPSTRCRESFMLHLLHE